MEDIAAPAISNSAADSTLSSKMSIAEPFVSDASADKPQNLAVRHQESSSPPHGSQKMRDPGDMVVDDSDVDTGVPEDTAIVSDVESVAADGHKANKKKKSQRFYCTEYPPCNLSFTRSEHLARHIRKHTGERPFQCHCSRRFSRLDNLRQHAQTVHVNEDIPMDSLAATGTRFQRQIRTDRVRPSNNRIRAGGAASIMNSVRGHSKSLSTSSINSVSSMASSVYSPLDEMRRRPPPLVMADSRNPAYRTGMDGQYRPLTPTDYASPPSATFSSGTGSPRWGHTIVSPSPSHGRAQSMYVSGARNSGRRLSVPSSSFQPPQPAGINRTLFSPSSMTPSHSSVYTSSNNASLSNGSYGNSAGALASPATSTASGWSRRDSTSTVGDEAWRRRTWHPDSREFNGTGGNQASTGSNSSNLSHVITSSQYQTSPVASLPLANPATQQTNLRLPGIESFDPLPRHRHGSPLHRPPSPMALDLDNSQPPPLPHNDIGVRDHRVPPNSGHWESPLHRNLNRLEIVQGNSPRDSSVSWSNETGRDALTQSDSSSRGSIHAPRHATSGVRFEDDVCAGPTHYGGQDMAPTNAYTRGHQHTVSAPTFHPNTPRHQKRQGWYQGPSQPMSSAEAEQQRGITARVDRMIHPNLASGFQGFPARVPHTVPEHRHQTSTSTSTSASPPPSTSQDAQRYSHTQSDQENPESMRRLEALVAVATSEASAATAY